jgi:PAS domain S-box-containing protein
MPNNKPRNKRLNDTASKLPDSKNLRHKAELIAIQENANIPETFEIISYDETLKISHELQVHQIELEMQNEALRQANTALSAERERYFNLYNFAPVGYCTLSAESLIIEANLTAAKIFGMGQSELVQQPMTRFIHPEDQDIYYLYRKKLLNSQEKLTCELRLKRQNAADYWVCIVASIEKINDEAVKIQLIITDITEKNGLKMR